MYFYDILESPIEKLFLRKFLSKCWENKITVYLIHGGKTETRQPPKEKNMVTVYPQFVMGKYRVDFKLETSNMSAIIECDGHQWHEKTKEQAVRDKTRDRYLQDKVNSIYRYTGREIFTNGTKCVNKLLFSLKLAYCRKPKKSENSLIKRY